MKMIMGWLSHLMILNIILVINAGVSVTVRPAKANELIILGVNRGFFVFSLFMDVSCLV
jgi:hypothetical protein